MRRTKGRLVEPQDKWLTAQLRDAELAVAYLNGALAAGDQAAFMLALRNVAKARGGVALSRSLSESGNPELRTLTRILEAAGLVFLVVPRSRAKRLQRPHSRRSVLQP